ncbi:c-type cytochrome [Candidatus Magnetominusculus xianensis]|uniref:Cytochrome C oxidase n=1 Tax=Candidatus Magnetominusculus xianensis TaxID=1748249 RepID=A0ABR5SEY6_9BACT|nr:ethylbenzene dehydrogenase-related protein [Candidatus Magnetominusculus xianensis]KWT76410.1 cytochrome C oxidase [Candidatus Magnetominusculus xianensis]MBF0404878.1 c-type cytochrome [Nitrospirota bacterium]
MRILIALLIAMSFPVYGFSAEKAAANPEGKKVYDGWCAQCHGYKGDADSFTKDVSLPQPRDFTFGTYKFRSTPSGDPPTDEDITKIIRKGNPGTSMPPWTRFTDAEVKAVVEHVKSFAPDTFAMERKPINIGNPPKASKEIIEQGKEQFKIAKCVDCHGKTGRGDGDKGWQDDFKTDWGYGIAPADYTHGWELRNGSTLEDIYRTISVGLSGTPMTSYLDSLPDDKRWALAHFITSLQLTRKLGLALKVGRVESLPSKPNDPAWEKVDYLDLPMGGQLMFDKREFTPVITNVRVRGLYTSKELVILLQWTDKKPNDGSDGKPADSVRIQFPVKKHEGSELPYFFMGTSKAPVNMWQWKASDKEKVFDMTAKGPDKVEPKDKAEATVMATYEDGLYSVVFKKELKSAKDDPVFEIGKFIPFSITAFDGRNGEDGLTKGAVSAWYYLMMEPPTPMQVYVFPPVVALGVLIAGIGLHKSLRKNKKG